MQIDHVPLKPLVAGDSVFADAQIRRVIADGDEFVVGLQLIALEQTPEGKRALRLIGEKVGECQRQTLRQMAPSGAAR